MSLPTLLTYLRLKLTVLIFRLFFRIGPIASGRRLDDTLTSHLHIQTQRAHIPSRDRHRTIPVDIYYPPDQSSPSVPVLVNWHGSGFIFPGHGADALYCARLACDAGIIVVDADYRKGPESPFPAAVHDVEDVLRWVGGQASGFDKSRVCVSGFSAGGNLALVAASGLRKTLKEEVGLEIRMVVAVYPVTNLSIRPEAKKVKRPKRPLPGWLVKVFNQCYVPDEMVRKDPRVSPALAGKEEFPGHVVIVACEGDILAPEARALAERLDDGTRKVVFREMEDTHHAFDKGCKPGSEDERKREEVIRLVVENVKATLTG